VLRGAFRNYNVDSGSDEKFVFRNDLLTAVNGASDPDEMWKKMTEPGKLTVEFAHPEHVTIVVAIKGQPLGMEVDSMDQISGVFHIVNITEGAIRKHNLTAGKDQRIKISDLIFAVNGLSHDLYPMYQEMSKVATQVAFTLLRRPTRTAVSTLSEEFFFGAGHCEVNIGGEKLDFVA